jgi:hypothetical protein
METNETREPKDRLTGKEGAVIDIRVAAEWTRNHRHRNPGGVISQFFGKEILTRILNQPDCVGIRIYFANSKPSTGWQRLVKKCFKSEGEVHLIVSGATMDGMDQLPESGKMVEGTPIETHIALARAAAGKSVLGEQAIPCPGGTGCPSNVLTGS